MGNISPSTRPRQTREQTLDTLEGLGVTDKVALMGVRGYYRDTMGKRGVNDRGLYDDVIFLVSPQAYVAFNANTDPSVYRRGIATLQQGVWRYKVGTHGLSRPRAKRYTALVQADEVTVTRDGQGEDTGWFGINIHRGGHNTTSSLGCQTIVPEQWPAFIALVQSELRRHGQKTLPYVLISNA